MPEMKQYEILRACWLSGQISDLEMHQRMQADPDLCAWMGEQARVTASEPSLHEGDLADVD